MFIAYSDLKTADFHNFFADTICSCTEAVDELFEHALGHECMEQDINTYYICSYMPIAYSALKRADFNILASDTNCSCIEDNQCVLKWSF